MTIKLVLSPPSELGTGSGRRCAATPGFSAAMGSESKHGDWTLLATEHYDFTPLAVETRGRQAEATES